MPGRALMSEYRRSYKPSQFRCAATTYINNREFRLQQLQRFQNHSADPFIWPDHDDDDDDSDDDESRCGRTDAAGIRSRREPFEPAYQYRHRQLKSLYERRADADRPVDRPAPCDVEQRDIMRNDSTGCSSSTEEEEDDRSSVVHIVGPSRHDDCRLCMESKQTQTPPGWCAGEKPPFALYGHRHDDHQTGAKKTYNVKAAKEVSASAVRARLQRQSDKTPSVASTSLRRVDHSVPVLVPTTTAADRHGLPPRAAPATAWTSEYEREYQPYERSRYRAQVDNISRRLHSDLKPATPHTHRSYLVTC